MDLFTNDLSIQEQFHDLASFRDALDRLMAMRGTARRFRREVYCHRALLTTNPMPNTSMQQAIWRLPVESERRAVMGWLTRGGPFWEDLRRHGIGDYLECGGDIVTDSAVGEAAFRTLNNIECGLVSVTPSDWDFSPVKVTWRREDEGLDDKTATLENWRDATRLEEWLCDAAAPIQSWDDLRETSTSRFRSLTFANDCFKPLAGITFAKGAAGRFVVLLGILDRLARAFDADGVQTPEAQRIYEDYFKGKSALFSDSSETEKSRFRKKLTFPHPDYPRKSLFCTWHGKVRQMTLRLHYSWSGKFRDTVYIAYLGPKITKL